MGASRNRLKAAIAINLLVVAFEAWAMWFGICRHGLVGNFIFYTEWSNLLAGVACAVCAVVEVRELRGGPACPRAARWLKFAACCCLLMTLLVVAFVLTPMLYSVGRPGLNLMFVEGAKSVTHLGAPLVVTASYVAFEADRAMTFRQSLVGFVPTLVYAAIAYPHNILGFWDGPYPFLQVWTMPVWLSMVWFAVLCVLALSLCQVPRLLGRLHSRRVG